MIFIFTLGQRGEFAFVRFFPKHLGLIGDIQYKRTCHVSSPMLDELKGKRKFGKNRVRIKDQVNISQRPKHVELRIEVGHWEGDLMIGTGQKSAIGTIVERKTRYTFIVKIENRKSKTVTQQFAKLLNTLPKYIRKTMTYDNGIEMANHKWLSNNTGMDIYFANPYSSWERGTNENTNGLIRRFFPKGTDFNKITIEQLKQAQFALNNRPRKILGYKTPNEIMNQEITNYAA